MISSIVQLFFFALVSSAWDDVLYLEVLKQNSGKPLKGQVCCIYFILISTFVLT